MNHLIYKKMIKYTQKEDRKGTSTREERNQKSKESNADNDTNKTVVVKKKT